MSTEKLIHMANQMADFFRTYPEAQAAVGIRDHLLAFWTPGMRNAIATEAAQRGGTLDPLVVKALELLPPQESQEAMMAPD